MKPDQSVSSIDTRYTCISEGCKRLVPSEDMLCDDCICGVAADTAARLSRRSPRSPTLCPACGAMMYEAKLLKGYPKTGPDSKRRTCALHGPLGRFRHIATDEPEGLTMAAPGGALIPADGAQWLVTDE